MHRALTGALREHGAKQRFEGTFSDGECTDLLVSNVGDAWTVRIQLVDLPFDQFSALDDELRGALGRFDWMVGPEADRTARILVNRDGYVVRIRCGEEEGERVVRLGIQERAAEDIEWYRLADCRIEDNGVVRPPTPAPAPTEPIGVDHARVLAIVVALRKACRSDDAELAIELITQHADVIALVEQPGLERERRVLTEINAWAFAHHRAINSVADGPAYVLSKKARRKLQAELNRLRESVQRRRPDDRI
ncbi:hypothetical protein [Nocardia jinanensis]|nr:hypothetical protein [Nocardia jinanensis]